MRKRRQRQSRAISPALSRIERLCLAEGRTSMSEIVCTDVTKVWGTDARREVVAQDSVSLRVRHEKFRVVIGPSSCGKSTFLRM
jgi:ABC-type glutathione transport system ATPase component